MKLPVGDYFYRLPGVLSSINISWNKDYPWEIKLDKGEPDSDMLILPQILDVSISFKPVHAFTPNNSQNAPFISINGREGLGIGAPNWLRDIEQSSATTSTNETDLNTNNVTGDIVTNNTDIFS